jgi:hypothetical protein
MMVPIDVVTTDAEFSKVWKKRKLFLPRLGTGRERRVTVASDECRGKFLRPVRGRAGPAHIGANPGPVFSMPGGPFSRSGGLLYVGNYSRFALDALRLGLTIAPKLRVAGVRKEAR